MKQFWERLFSKKPTAPTSAPTEALRARPSDVRRPLDSAPAAPASVNPADEVALALLDAATVDGSIRDPCYVFAPSDTGSEDTCASAIKTMEGAGRHDIADQIRQYGYRRMRFALTARDTFSGVALDAVSRIQAGRAAEIVDRVVRVPMGVWKTSSAGEHASFLRHALEHAAQWCLSVGRESDAAILYVLIVELQLEAQVFPSGSLWGPGNA